MRTEKSQCWAQARWDQRCSCPTTLLSMSQRKRQCQWCHRPSKKSSNMVATTRDTTTKATIRATTRATIRATKRRKEDTEDTDAWTLGWKSGLAIVRRNGENSACFKADSWHRHLLLFCNLGDKVSDGFLTRWHSRICKISLRMFGGTRCPDFRLYAHGKCKEYLVGYFELIWIMLDWCEVYMSGNLWRDTVKIRSQYLVQACPGCNWWSLGVLRRSLSNTLDLWNFQVAGQVKA